MEIKTQDLPLHFKGIVPILRTLTNNTDSDQLPLIAGFEPIRGYYYPTLTSEAAAALDVVGRCYLAPAETEPYAGFASIREIKGGTVGIITKSGEIYGNNDGDTCWLERSLANRNQNPTEVPLPNLTLTELQERMAQIAREEKQRRKALIPIAEVSDPISTNKFFPETTPPLFAENVGQKERPLYTGRVEFRSGDPLQMMDWIREMTFPDERRLLTPIANYVRRATRSHLSEVDKEILSVKIATLLNKAGLCPVVVSPSNERSESFRFTFRRPNIVEPPEELIEGEFHEL